jgi:hypothetical protein
LDLAAPWLNSSPKYASATDNKLAVLGIICIPSFVVGSGVACDGDGGGGGGGAGIKHMLLVLDLVVITRLCVLFCLVGVGVSCNLCFRRVWLGTLFVCVSSAHGKSSMISLCVVYIE